MQAQVHAIPNAIPANNNLDQEAAGDRIKSVRLFAFGGVGFAGTTSEGEKAYRVIMAAPVQRAIDIWINAYRTGTPEAKAYALTGLRQLSFPEFEKLAAQASTSRQVLTVAHGCILTKTTLAEVANRLNISH